MGLIRCEKCLHVLCEGDCIAWIDGVAYTLRQLVQMWGIQARQVRKHLVDGTKPRCADKCIVRRVDDGKWLRPCARRGSRPVYLYIHGRTICLRSVGEAARVLGVPRTSLHRIVHDPRRVVPAEWKCVALRTDKGIRYKALRFISGPAA